MVGRCRGLRRPGLHGASLWSAAVAASEAHGLVMAWPWLGHGSAMAWPWLGHPALPKRVYSDPSPRVYSGCGPEYTRSKSRIHSVKVPNTLGSSCKPCKTIGKPCFSMYFKSQVRCDNLVRPRGPEYTRMGSRIHSVSQTWDVKFYSGPPWPEYTRMWSRIHSNEMGPNTLGLNK